MKKILLTVLVALVGLLMMSPPASAIPKEAKGCPAEASVWTQVDFVTGDYTHMEDTGFYIFYWNLTDGDKKVVDIYRADGWTDEEIYGMFAGFFDRVIDRNHDSYVCVWWVGEHFIGQTHKDMTYFSAVDNNANANY